jgi:hypothetical protein
VRGVCRCAGITGGGHAIGMRIFTRILNLMLCFFILDVQLH